MRESKDEVQVIGSFNSESLFTPLQAENSEQSLLEACGRGYFVVGILGVNQEPTNHALRDIAAFKAGLEKWGRKMVLLFPNEAQYKKFRPDEFPLAVYHYLRYRYKRYCSADCRSHEIKT